MQIVTDCGADLVPAQMEKLNIHSIPLQLTLDGRTYASGIDISPEDFYKLIQTTASYPTTSQPSAGDFAVVYRELAKTDPEILSIHISSGLSGTLNSARTAATMVPEAKITFFDTMTLSCPEGWQVQAAALALQKGWQLEDILKMLATLRSQVQGLFTVPTMKYLIHGGRISHLKGLLASILNIKPIIGVEKEHGTYFTYGQERTLPKAITRMADKLLDWWPEGSALRIQPIHGDNMEGIEILKTRLNQLFKVTYEPVTTVAPVLGAHTGAGVVGLAAGPMSLFKDIL